MKKLFCLFFMIFALVSCGGNEQNEPEEKELAVSLRVARDASNDCISISCIAEKIDAIYFEIKEGENIIKEKSLTIEELGNQTTLTGIKNATNATLTVKVLQDRTAKNSVTWQGRATKLHFEKGKTTEVKIQLYPVNKLQQEASMPQKLNIPRFGHSATVLSDGRILIAGGFTSCGSNHKCLAEDSVEIIDLESGEIEKLEQKMSEPRALHKAVLMDDGSVIFIGGVKALYAAEQTEDEAFEDYPLLPYSFSTTAAVTKIEKYMPSYPKYNKKLNEPEPESVTANTTELIKGEDGNTFEAPFKAFQSVFVDQTAENKIDVFLVGGLDVEESEDSENSKGKPSNKSYRFSITNNNGTATASAVTNLADSSEPMLLPALAHTNGSILAVGGRPGTSEYAASLISESSSDNKGKDSGLNLFFTNNIAVDRNLYTFAGFNAEKIEKEDGDESSTIKYSHKILKWDVFGDAPTHAPQNEKGNEYVVYPGKGEVAFGETVYDEINERIILIGGTGGASNIYQVISSTTLEWYQGYPSHDMKVALIMPKAVVIPARKSPTEQLFIVITGGINTIDGTGSATGNVRINNI